MHIRFTTSRCRNVNGFSMIEVLIAMAIFSIGMLGIAGLQIRATQSNATARSSTDLTAYATDQMEILAGLPYDASDLSVLAIDDPPHSDSDDSGRFSSTWTVAEDDIVEDTKTVTLTATETLRGNTRTLTLRYVIPEM